MKDIEKQVDEGLKNIEAMIAANKESQDAEFEAMKKAAAENGEKLQRTEDWIKKVEATVDSARRTPSNSDTLLDSIPAEYRRHVEMGVRLNKKDPVKDAALGLWWHYQHMIPLAASGRMKAPHTAHEYRQMADNLVTAWGYDPTVKALASLEEDTAVLGGNVIATPVEAELMRLIQDNGVMRPLVTKMAMTTKTHQIPNETNGITAYIVAEAGLIGTATNATTFGQEPITAKKFASLATVSNELLQDNIIMLGDYLFTAIAEKIARLEDSEALDGATNFTGLAAVAGRFTFNVTGTTSGGDAPSYDELVKTLFGAKEAATRQNSWWMMHPIAMRHVVGLVDDNGQPIFQYANVPGAIQMSILGYPVALSSVVSLAQTVKTTSTNIYYGPPSKIIFGDLAGMGFDTDPFGLFATAQTRIRVIKRTGITIPVGEYFSVLQGVKNAV